MTVFDFLIVVDKICFLIIALSVLYLLFFALISNIKNNYRSSQSKKFHSIILLVPAYKEDNVIKRSVESFLNQDYPKDKFQVLVISDKMRDDTNTSLSDLGAHILKPDFEKSSKAKALNFAIDNLDNTKYDIVVIMDADNIVESNFLKEINNAYYSGSKAIQAHRQALNFDTDVAILDAASEEINNSIFRKGHVNIGLSSALIGSGMAFDFKLFKENVKKLYSAGEDKELELLLLKQRVFINYLDNVKVLDLKTQKAEVFYNQRRRWLASQFNALAISLKELPRAIFTFNIEYLDKVFQLMMLPRVMLLGIILIVSLFTSVLSWQYSLKWWGLLLLLAFAFALALPDYLVDKRLIKACKKVPLLALLMTLNLFRIKGATNKFIHTKKD